MQRRFGSEHSEFTMDDSVLAVYVEPILVDRRVLFVGDARSDALTRVASVAARVLALDTSTEAIFARLPNGAVEPFDPLEVERLDLEFDVVFVADAARLGHGLSARIEDFARMLGGRGRLVMALSAASKSLDYADLWDMLAIHFEVVRMAGAAPMNALAIAELGEGEAPAVVVDGTLVTRPARTESFVAICSQRALDIEGYVIVQVDSVAAPKASALEARALPAADLARLRSLEQNVGAMTSELEVARLALGTTRAERDAFRDERKRLERELRSAHDELVRTQRSVVALEDAAKGTASSDEIRMLEEVIAERSERIHELDAEVARRGRLVRELIEETRDGRAAHGADTSELERAVERALRADAMHAEALFTIDELRARIADTTDAGVERLREREAELAGRTRGLLMRLAEAEQRAGQLEVELLAAHASAASALDEVRLAAATQQRMGTLVVSENTLSSQVGQLGAQLMMSRERELESRAARDIARGENLALVAQVAALETQHRELRERLVVSLDGIAGHSGASGSIESALQAAEASFSNVKGERNGLRMRLESSEGSAARTHAQQSVPRDPAFGDPEPASSEIAVLRLENEALAADLAEAKAAHRRASDVSLATRDALVERLQLELAEHERRSAETIERERTASAEVARLREALVEAATTSDSQDTQTRRINVLERDLADAIVAAERAAADARSQAAQLAEATRRHAADLGATTDRATAAEVALAETRAILTEFESAQASRTGPIGRRSTDLAADDDDRSASLDGEKDLLLRSLGAQIEERDDKIRALERRLSGVLPSSDSDEEALRQEVLNLQERASRLADELRVEREARRDSDERASRGLGTAAVASNRELERRAEVQSHELEEAAARAEASERDVRAMRDVFGETRASLEALLGASSGAGDPDFAARIGQLLTVLGRY